MNDNCTITSGYNISSEKKIVIKCCFKYLNGTSEEVYLKRYHTEQSTLLLSM